MHYGNISSSDEDTSEDTDEDSDDCCRDEDYSDQEGPSLDQLNRLTVQQRQLVAESGKNLQVSGQKNQPKLTTLRSAGEDVRGL